MVRIQIVRRKSARNVIAIPAVGMDPNNFHSNESGRFWKDKSRPTRSLRKGYDEFLRRENAAVTKSKPNAEFVRRQQERERRQVIKELSNQLKSEIEQESERVRTERRKAKERRLENEKSSMVLQRISRVRAMKKLSPHARRRLGIYAQHELNAMLQQSKN
eukprot:PhF_6_TR4714/c0_g1_i1/m.6529/K14822/CGR1; rRNA-processing protein CGR1